MDKRTTPTQQGVSRCNQCGSEYPSAPAGYIHKCGRCGGGLCSPTQRRTTPTQQHGLEAIIHGSMSKEFDRREAVQPPANTQEEAQPMTELVERLRDYMVREKPLRDEAADAIEAKDARIAELEGALEQIVSVMPESTGELSTGTLAGLLYNVEIAARTALLGRTRP